jgi:hypothetical protein
MSPTVLDPTDEKTPSQLAPADRIPSIEGLTIGLLDISKARGDVFLDRLEQRLIQLDAKVIRYAKPTFAKPAPVDLRHQIATQCDAVIEALAD